MDTSPSAPADLASLIADLPADHRAACTLEQLGDCCRWALDTQQDNADEPETAADYFPHCVAQMLEDRKFDAAIGLAGPALVDPPARPRYRRGHR